MARKPKKAKKAKKPTRKATPRPKAKKPNGRPPPGTPDWAPAFLAALLEGLHVRDAATHANVCATTVYDRRKTDEAFRDAWKEAQEIGTEALEAEAARRAYHGTLKPVFHQGIECGYIREYSDKLLVFLLQSRDPAKYRTQMKHEIGGEGGGAIPIQIVGVEIAEPDAPE